MPIRENSSVRFNYYLKYVGCAIIALLPLLTYGGWSVRAQPSDSDCQYDCANDKSSACWELKGGNQTIYNRCIAKCVKDCEAVPPTITLNLKYLVLGLLYAPPGCTNSAHYQCNPGNPPGPSIADYAEGSSLGSKVSVNNSFKVGTQVSGSVSSGVFSFGADVGFSATWTDNSSVTVIKSTGLEVTVSGIGDGIDHGQDMFLLLVNPTVTLTNQSGNMYWYPGISGPSAKIVEVYVSELRTPRTMRTGVARVLQQLGFTPQDYACILALDPYGGPSTSTDRFGVRPVYCKGEVATLGGGGPPLITLDPVRFRPTLWNLPYEPPTQNNPCTTSAKSLLKNEFIREDSSSYEEDYTVDFTFGAGKADKWGLKDTSTFTWTSSSTETSTRDSSQSATVTITCPSIDYNDSKINVQVYWDSLYATFLFVLVDPSTMSVVHVGKVQDASGKPVSGQQVDMTYGGKTYHTLTASSGNYRFFAPAGQPPPSGNAVVTVRGVQETVSVGSQTPTVIRLR